MNLPYDSYAKIKFSFGVVPEIDELFKVPTYPYNIDILNNVCSNFKYSLVKYLDTTSMEKICNKI